MLVDVPLRAGAGAKLGAQAVPGTGALQHPADAKDPPSAVRFELAVRDDVPHVPQVVVVEVAEEPGRAGLGVHVLGEVGLMRSGIRA